MKKNFPQLSAIVCILSFLTACGATSTLTDADLHKPIPTGNSRLIFTRVSAVQYVGGAATVDVNGERVVSIGSGGQAFADVKTGHQKISVSTPASFTDYSLSLDTKAGHTYHFLIKPNPDGEIASTVFGALGNAVQANGKGNGGYFKIEQIK